MLLHRWCCPCQVELLSSSNKPNQQLLVVLLLLLVPGKAGEWSSRNEQNLDQVHNAASCPPAKKTQC